MRINKLLLSGINAAALALSFSAFGATAAVPQNSNSGVQMVDKSYYIPHVYLSGYGGSNLLGNLDVLAPVYLMSDRNLYLYGAANYAGAEESDQDNSWSAVFGAGYRQMFNWTGSQRIYGAYVLGSYNYSSYGNDYWVINPGIESLGQRWDYRVNAYLPVSNHSFAYQDFASNHGDDSHVSSHDNQTDDMLVTYYENVGYGADAEFGGRLFSIAHMPVKGYIDGYYYNVDNSNITNPEESGNTDIFGVGARITFQPTSYLSIELKDTYDNENENVFEVGAKIYFNGFRYGATNTHVDDQDLQVRLFDDIEHNFGTINSAQSSFVHQGNTDNAADDPYNPIVPIEDHQIFYSGDVTTGGDGTAENPYPASDLDQTSVDAGYNTWDNAQFVLASGESSSYEAGAVEMYDGTSMVGKTSDYTALATGSDRPVVYGALTLDGNNIIDSIILHNTGAKYTSGITVADNAKGVLIQNSDIGTFAKDIDTSYTTGISVGKNAQVTIKNDNIDTYVNGEVYAGISSIGVDAEAGSNVSIIDTSIDSYYEYDNFEDSAYQSIGVNAVSATLNLYNSTISSYGDNGSAYGMYVTGGSVSITGSLIEADNSQLYSVVGRENVYGIYASGATLTVNSSQIKAIGGDDPDDLYAAGIYATGSSTLSIFSSSIVVDAFSSVGSAGIYADSSTVSMQSGSLSVSGGDDVFGVYAVNNSKISVASGQNALVTIDLYGETGTQGHAFGIYGDNTTMLKLISNGTNRIIVTNHDTGAGGSYVAYSDNSGTSVIDEELFTWSGFINTFHW